MRVWLLAAALTLLARPAAGRREYDLGWTAFAR
jgi:hypothetical protein